MTIEIDKGMMTIHTIIENTADNIDDNWINVKIGLTTQCK